VIGASSSGPPCAVSHFIFSYPVELYDTSAYGMVPYDCEDVAHRKALREMNEGSMTSVLYNFLKAGHLGAINIDMHIGDVLALLGAPDEFKRVKAYYDRLPQMKQYAYEMSPYAPWFRAKYGLLDILFHADTDRVVFFKVYFQTDHERIIPDILNDGWLPLVDGITRSQLRMLLKEAEIQSHEVLMGQWADDIAQIWIPSSQLEINFNLEEQRDDLLVMSRSSPDIGGNPCASRDCIDFS
jgi:hypothetical protein